MITFRNYSFCEKQDGESIELFSSSDEKRFLAFDQLLGHFVDFHLFTDQQIHQNEFRTRAQEARELRSEHLAKFVAWGEDDGMWFYITRLIDGPTLESYFRWLLDVPRPVFNHLLAEYCRIILEIAPNFHLIPEVKLSDLQVVRNDKNGIKLMLSRFALQPVATSNQKEARLQAFPVLDEWIYGDLDEKIPAIEAMDAFKMLTSLDPQVCFRQFKNLLQTLENENLANTTVDSIHQPNLLLLDKVLSGPSVLERRLEDRYQIEGQDGWPTNSYTVDCLDSVTNKKVTVGFLPSKGILPEEGTKSLDEALARTEKKSLGTVPLIEWNPNFNKLLGCYVEEQINGFSLNEHLNKREDSLSIDQVAVILEKVESILQELAGSRSILPRLHPKDIFFTFKNEVNPKKLPKSSLEEFPEYTLKLRAHSTMESIGDGCSSGPQLAEAPKSYGSPAETARLAPNITARMYTELAFKLLGIPPDADPEYIKNLKLNAPLQALLLEEHSSKYRTGPPIPPARFLARFKEIISKENISEIKIPQSSTKKTAYKSLSNSKERTTPKSTSSKPRKIASHKSKEFVSLTRPPSEIKPETKKPDSGVAEVLFSDQENLTPKVDVSSISAQKLLKEQKRKKMIKSALLTALLAFGLFSLYKFFAPESKRTSAITSKEISVKEKEIDITKAVEPKETKLQPITVPSTPTNQAPVLTPIAIVEDDGPILRGPRVELEEDLFKLPKISPLVEDEEIINISAGGRPGDTVEKTDLPPKAIGIKKAIDKESQILSKTEKVKKTTPVKNTQKEEVRPPRAEPYLEKPLKENIIIEETAPPPSKKSIKTNKPVAIEIN